MFVLTMLKQNYQNLSKSARTLLQISFYKGLFEIFQKNFLIKAFLLQYYINLPNFITRLCLLSKLFSKMCFVINAKAFDDVMTLKYLKN